MESKWLEQLVTHEYLHGLAEGGCIKGVERVYKNLEGTFRSDELPFERIEQHLREVLSQEALRHRPSGTYLFAFDDGPRVRLLLAPTIHEARCAVADLTDYEVYRVPLRPIAYLEHDEETREVNPDELEALGFNVEKKGNVWVLRIDGHQWRFGENVWDM